MNSENTKQEPSMSCAVTTETNKSKTQPNKLIHKFPDDYFTGRSLTLSFNCIYVNPKLLK